MRTAIANIVAMVVGAIILIILVLAAASQMCSPAHASAYQDQRGEWYDIQLPPPHYFDKPYEYPITRNFLPESEIDRVCSGAVGHYERFGCAFVYTNRCVIYISSDLPAPFRDGVHYHEVGHCFGWPMHHPQR